MNTYAEKAKETKSQAVSSAVYQKQSSDTSKSHFVNNRPEAIVQRKLHELVKNSPQTMQLKVIQEMANNSPQAKQATKLLAMADDYAAQQTPFQKNGNKNSSAVNDEVQKKSKGRSTFQFKDNRLGKSIQLKVMPNRGKPGFHSTKTGRVDYSTETEAIEAEARYDREQAELREQEQPQVAFNFVAPEDGPPVPNTPLASALLEHPVHFGPVLTTGGDVSAAQVNSLAPQTVMPPSPRTAFSARNTHAMVLSHTAEEYSVHSHTGASIPLSSISYESHSPRPFWAEHVFRQGPPPDHVYLPDTRQKAHAEALASRSDAFSLAVEQNARDIMNMSEAAGYDSSLGVDKAPTDAQLENLSLFLGSPRVGTTIAINRASCGKRGRSGYSGGCNQEMADAVSRYEDKLDSNMDEGLAFIASKTGMASFGVSAAGPYKHQGNPSIMSSAGVDVNQHNAFNWQRRQAKPLSAQQQQYLARANQRGEEKEEEKIQSM